MRRKSNFTTAETVQNHFLLAYFLFVDFFERIKFSDIIDGYLYAGNLLVR